MRGNKILTSIKGHNYVINRGKLMCNNPNQDLVDINAYAKFGQNSSAGSHDIVRAKMKF